MSQASQLLGRPVLSGLGRQGRLSEDVAVVYPSHWKVLEEVVVAPIRRRIGAGGRVCSCFIRRTEVFGPDCLQWNDPGGCC